MTAAVTALGLAPLAFGLTNPAQEIEGPMAVTVLGGLISSTLLEPVRAPRADVQVREAAGEAPMSCQPN